jgi:hypothetical protein
MPTQIDPYDYGRLAEITDPKVKAKIVKKYQGMGLGRPPTPPAGGPTVQQLMQSYAKSIGIDESTLTSPNLQPSYEAGKYDPKSAWSVRDTVQERIKNMLAAIEQNNPGISKDDAAKQLLHAIRSRNADQGQGKAPSIDPTVLGKLGIAPPQGPAAAAAQPAAAAQSPVSGLSGQDYTTYVQPLIERAVSTAQAEANIYKQRLDENWATLTADEKTLGMNYYDSLLQRIQQIPLMYIDKVQALMYSGDKSRKTEQSFYGTNTGNSTFGDIVTQGQTGP